MTLPITDRGPRISYHILHLPRLNNQDQRPTSEVPEATPLGPDCYILSIMNIHLRCCLKPGISAESTRGTYQVTLQWRDRPGGSARVFVIGVIGQVPNMREIFGDGRFEGPSTLGQASRRRSSSRYSSVRILVDGVAFPPTSVISTPIRLRVGSNEVQIKNA